ncbi:hypothetical protein FDECE_12282 [Fusarium decemcellulare]|nr:hypothetical protein FDECE_12282 [Fusarium decemcellulare]
MLLNRHFHALALECQGDAPDDREADPDQKGAVTFHMLKVMDSYHDNIEHMNITKWMTQLSVEIGLPPWLEFELMEICICEAIKNAWHTPFNRYSWIVKWEYSKGQMAYHSDHVIIMGHIFSMLARVFWESSKNDQEFWNDNLNYIIEAARRLTDPKKGKLRSVQQAETGERRDWIDLSSARTYCKRAEGAHAKKILDLNLQDEMEERIKTWVEKVLDENIENSLKQKLLEPHVLDEMKKQIKDWAEKVIDENVGDDNLRKEFEKDNSILNKSAQVREAAKDRKQTRVCFTRGPAWLMLIGTRTRLATAREADYGTTKKKPIISEGIRLLVEVVTG